MIDIAAARTGIAQLITTRLGTRCTVYRSALDATASLPLIALGVLDFRPEVQTCADVITIPIATVVQINSGAAEANQDQLEDLWSDLIEGLREEIILDPGLNVAQNAIIGRATFGSFTVQGQDYPALVTHLELYG